jgi:tape measure domain-containing protein
MANGGLHFTASIDTANFMRQMEQVKSQMKQFSADVEKQGGSIDAVFDRLTKAAASFGVAFSVKEVVSKVAQVRGEFQQLEVAFETMLGNKSKANALMSQLVETAAITPFGLNDVANGAKLLLAYGTEAEKVNDTLVRLGDIAAGLSIPLNDLTYLYGTTMVQGRMYTQDLNQFLGRGIPLVDELANQFGVTKDKVKGLVEEGKVGFPEVEKAIISMTSEGSKFGGLMAEQSKTISGQIGNIEDAIESMFNEIGKQSEGIINTGLSITSALVENWQKVGEAIGVAITAYGSYKAVLMTVTAYQKVNMTVLRAAVVEKQAAAAASLTMSNAEAIAAARTKLLTLAQQGLIKALKSVAAATIANPYVLAAAAITGLVYGIYKYVTAETAAEKAQRTLNERLDEAKKKQEEYNNETKEAISTIQDETKATEDKDQAMQMLIARYPEIIKKYIDEKGHLRDILKLKEEIANYDANRQRTDTTKNLKQSADDADYYAKLADSIVKNKNGANNAANVVKLRKQYKADSGASELSVMNTSISAIRDYYKNLAATSRKAYNRNLTENRISDFTKEGGALEDYSDEALRKLQQRLRNGQTKKNAEDLKNGKDHALYYEELGDYLNYNDRATLLTRIEGMLNARSEAKGSSSDWVTSLKKDYDTKLKEYTDYISNKGNKVSLAEFEKKSAELKSAADDAKKKYDSAKGNSGASSTKTGLKKEQDEYSKLVNENAQKRIRESQDLQMKVDQANIDAMKEGTDKTIAQLELDFEKQMQEIDRQKEDLLKSRKDEAKNQFDKDPANKGKTFDDSDIKLTDQEIQNFNQLYINTMNNFEKSKAKAYQSEVQQLQDYLKEYGTYKEKQLVIEKEYDDKIKKAQESGDTFEVLSLRAQKQKEVGANKTAMLESQIDYSTVFSDFGIILRDQMQTTLNAMKEYSKTSDFKSRDITQQKDFLEKMAQIERDYGTSKWDDHSFIKLGKLIDDYNVKLTKRNKAEDNLNNSSAELLNANEEYIKALKDGTKEQQEAAKAKLESAKANNDQDRIELQNADSDLANAQNGVTDAATKLHSSLSAVDNLLQSMKSGSLSSVWNAFTDFDKKINGGKATEAVTKSIGKILGKAFEGKSDIISLILGAILNLLDTLAEQGVGGIIGGLIDSILKAVEGIIDNILSGKFIEQIVGTLIEGVADILDNIIGHLGSALSGGLLSSDGPSAWFTNSNEGEVKDKQDKLVNAADDLKESLDALTSELKEQSGSKAISTAKDAVDVQQQLQYNALEQLKNQLSYHSAHHSNNYYWSNTDWSDEYTTFSANKQVGSWASINETLKKYLEANPNAKTTINSATNLDDLLQLTPEQLDYIRTHNREQWNAIMDVGYYDNSEYWNAYADMAGQMEEITETLRESLLNTSFDSLKDDFISNLEDMDMSASDFADNFSEYLMKSVLNAKISNLLEDDLQKFYDEWGEMAEANDGILTTDNINQLKEEWEKLAQRGLDIRDEVASITGYDAAVSEQSASSKSFSTMSQDTADELNGRFTALQESNEIIKEQMLASVEGSQSLLAVTTEGNNILNSILLQHVATNTHLEDLVKYTKPLLEFGAKLDKLIDQTKNI